MEPGLLGAVEVQVYGGQIGKLPARCPCSHAESLAVLGLATLPSLLCFWRLGWAFCLSLAVPP